MSKPIHSTSLEAAIRAYFGLTQDELARYLGITRGQVAHLEAGRRLPTSAQNRKLLPLALLLPPPEGVGVVAPDFTVAPEPVGSVTPLPVLCSDFGALVPSILRQRWRTVTAQATALRWSLHRELKRVALQRRRQWGLVVLRGAFAQAPDTFIDQAHLDQWLCTLAADVAAATPDPAAATSHALAVVRVLVLEAEAATLNQLLAKA